MNVIKQGKTQLHGVGLGFRRPLITEMQASGIADIDFIELAPENWLNVGGRRAEELAYLAERLPFVCHGLSLSIGSSNPLDKTFLSQLKTFFQRFPVRVYSEHLSYSSDDGYLYDLLPLPFSSDAVTFVAKRIRECQDRLERRIAFENISYYATVGTELTELEFINAILNEADCDLLLDVNNVYVNSVNHGYDPKAFIAGLSQQRVPYLHMAGHSKQTENLLIDTHGAPIIDPVWDLLAFTYQQFGVLPTLLERDFNLPPLEELLHEMALIRQVQHV